MEVTVSCNILFLNHIVGNRCEPCRTERAADQARWRGLPCSAAVAVHVSVVCGRHQNLVRTAASCASALPGSSDSCPQYFHQAVDQHPTPLLIHHPPHHSANNNAHYFTLVYWFPRIYIAALTICNSLPCSIQFFIHIQNVENGVVWGS